jgi:hypothetical protein
VKMISELKFGDKNILKAPTPDLAQSVDPQI